MIIDHIGLPVGNYKKSKEFYQVVLKPLGYGLMKEVFEAGAGFGKDQKPEFWIAEGPPLKHFHVAFAADSRAMVDAFYETALSIGGKDNGAPGVRGYYHPNYYGAFIIDPDGYNIEAVCHQEI